MSLSRLVRDVGELVEGEQVMVVLDRGYEVKRWEASWIGCVKQVKGIKSYYLVEHLQGVYQGMKDGHVRVVDDNGFLILVYPEFVSKYFVNGASR